MLSRVKNHRCCGGVISRHREPAIRAGNEPKSPVVMTMTPPGLRCRAHSTSVSRGSRQMLDDVEQDDDVERAEPGERRLVGDAADDVEAPSRGRMLRGVRGNLDAASLRNARLPPARKKP